MKILLLVLPLLAVCFCSETECPSQENTPDCICQQYRYGRGKNNMFTVFCNNIRNYHTLITQVQTFQNYTIKLILRNITIDYLTYDIFNNISLAALIISNSSLDSIGPQDLSGKSLFKGSEDTLNHFSLGRQSKVKLLDWGHFSNLRQLQSIRLSRNKIDKFAGWDRLVGLSIYNFFVADTSMATLGLKTFARHKDLMAISVPRNQITTINRELFPKPANQLRTLVFTSNMLAFLPMDFFSEMPSLSFVNFKGNEFMILSEQVVLPVWHQLRGFMFEGNPVHCDYNFLWVLRNRERHDGQPRYTDLISVKCASPPKLKGKTIQDLTDSDLEMDNGLDK